MSAAVLNHTRWLSALLGLSFRKGSLALLSDSLFRLGMSYCTYWLVWEKRCLGSHWSQEKQLAGTWLAPGREWEVSCVFPPSAEACVHAGDSLLSSYLTGCRYWCLPLLCAPTRASVCVRVCLTVCVSVAERARGRGAAFPLPPLASPSPCSLSLRPSSLPDCTGLDPVPISPFNSPLFTIPSQPPQVRSRTNMTGCRAAPAVHKV